MLNNIELLQHNLDINELPLQVQDTYFYAYQNALKRYQARQDVMDPNSIHEAVHAIACCQVDQLFERDYISGEWLERHQ